MGTDIHGVFQRHDEATGQWHDIPSNYAQDRHYQLFAVLAGVRNGTGFAGVVTGEPVKPIAEPRGYPKDFVSECPDVFDANGKQIAESGLGESWKDFRAYLANIRKQGFAETIGKMNPGMHSVAVPILRGDGKVAGSVSNMSAT